MARSFDILGFGALAIDDIVYVDAPLSAEKGKVIRRAMDHGGNVATALVAARRLGGRAAFIGWLPDDPDADIGGRELAREGVDVSLAPRHAEALPIRSIITVGKDGDRFIAYDDDIKHGTSDTLPETVFRQAPVLLIDGYAIHALPAVRQARALGLSIVADIEWSKGADTDELLRLADHLVVPLAFGRTATGKADPVDILEALWSPDRAAVVLTDGGNGSFLRQAGDPGPGMCRPIPSPRSIRPGPGTVTTGPMRWGWRRANRPATPCSSRPRPRPFPSPRPAVVVAFRAGRPASTGCPPWRRRCRGRWNAARLCGHAVHRPRTGSCPVIGFLCGSSSRGVLAVPPRASGSETAFPHQKYYAR